jgi:hypothetical protein
VEVRKILGGDGCDRDGSGGGQDGIDLSHDSH